MSMIHESSGTAASIRKMWQKGPLHHFRTTSWYSKKTPEGLIQQKLAR